MPVVKEDVPITKVLGEPREGFSRHVFVGGNFFVLRMLNKFRLDLGVEALPQEMDASVARTVQSLQSQTATVSVDRVDTAAGRLDIDLAVQNLTGHKLPTAYPSRRVWLHVVVRDHNGKAIYESGALHPDGSIEGNDNDEDRNRFEPHYGMINRPDQVQIYESVMADPAGKPTTGLLTAVGYLKDNRLLPHGFEKTTADKDIAVHGEAEHDADFAAGGDSIVYSIAVGDSAGPFQVEAELWYQPIAFRWAMNLQAYSAMEPARFVRYYQSAASGSGVMLAHASAIR
jgi:hypothetical protein